MSELFTDNPREVNTLTFWYVYQIVACAVMTSHVVGDLTGWLTCQVDS